MKIICNDGFTASLVLCGIRLEVAYPSRPCPVLESLRGLGEDSCWTLSLGEIYEVVSHHLGWLDDEGSELALGELLHQRSRRMRLES
jgi:hypothetical protein